MIEEDPIADDMIDDISMSIPKRLFDLKADSIALHDSSSSVG